MGVVEVVAQVRANLTDELRKSDWRGDPNPMAGHCYVASEAVYWLTRGPEGPLRPVVASFDTPEMSGTHWWLVNPESGEVVDPTWDQFDEPFDYTSGRRCGFLTQVPSKRARIVIDRVLR